MFIHRLKIFFSSIVLLSMIFLIYTWYQDYQFKTNPLSNKIMGKIYKKEKQLHYLAFKNYKITKKIPIIISDKIPSNLFGAATYSNEEGIKIYLNKNRFKENINYMIDDVMPHEYAHAIMFIFKDFTKKNGGHTKRWENICIALKGLRCNRFVKHKDIIFDKTDIF